MLSIYSNEKNFLGILNALNITIHRNEKNSGFNDPTTYKILKVKVVWNPQKYFLIGIDGEHFVPSGRILILFIACSEFELFEKDF